MIRCLPDGSELEVVSGTHGNCVGAAFTPEGEPFACGTFYASDSMGAGLRDAIIHVVEGADYPIRNLVLNEHKRTGELMPPLTHLGVAAASGLAIYRDAAYGAGYEGNLFSALFNMHKVVRHVVEREGATFKSRNVDFLVSTNSDFHPTDVLEDADGSLLVVNTGAWFLNGCPTSQVSKPEVRGAIYRIRRQRAARVADPRGVNVAWNSLKPVELTRLLSDGRFAVRDHAVKQLAALGHDSLAALQETLTADKSVEARRNAIWALSRMDAPAARETARLGLSDSDDSVRQTAARASGTVRDAGAVPRLLELARTASPPLRREAATALGRLRPPEAVPALLEGMRGGGDRFMEHALIFALVQINNPRATQNGLADADPSVRRAALIALDQMDDGKLTPETATPFLSEADPRLQQTALWVIARHPGWAKSMQGFFAEWLAKENRDKKQDGQLTQQLLAFSHDPSIQSLVAGKLQDARTPVATRLLLLETIGQSPLKGLPEDWSRELQSSLAHADERVVRQAVATLRGAPIHYRLAVQRVDAEIKFPATRRKFAETKLNDNFFARWTGLIRIPQTAAYTFTAEADDTARLRLDGKTVVDTSGLPVNQPASGTVELEGGLHELEVDFVQSGGEAGCKVSWAAPGLEQEIVPARVLFHRQPTDESEATAPLEPGLIGEYYDLSGERPRFIDPENNPFAPPLLAVALNPAHDVSLRVEALAAATPLITRLEQPAFEFLTGCLDQQQPPLVRLAAADALRRANLGKAQLLALTQSLPKLGALEMARLITAYERNPNAEVGRVLIAALEKSAHLQSLSADILGPIVKAYPPEVVQLAEPLLQRLSPNREQQQARLTELQSVLNGGDIQRGREIFFGNKAVCFACHTVQGNGGRVGPDLSKIGEIRAGPDLLEAIVFPSASFARVFEPYLIITQDGEVHSAIIGRETADAIHTYDAARVETRIPRSTIREIRPGAVSVMPEGLDAALTKPELGDLIAFLRSLR